VYLDARNVPYLSPEWLAIPGQDSPRPWRPLWPFTAAPEYRPARQGIRGPYRAFTGGSCRACIPRLSYDRASFRGHDTRRAILPQGQEFQLTVFAQGETIAKDDRFLPAIGTLVATELSAPA